MSSNNVTIPNVDPQIVQRLQDVVNEITTATGKFQTSATNLDTTHTSVKNAIASVVADSSGSTIKKLSTTWQGTSKDGGKAHDALTSLIPFLTSLQTAIDDNMSAIKNGMAAILTAQSDQQKGNPASATTVSQLNNLMLALLAIHTAAGTSSTSIKGISIGGACSTGIQPGGPLPNFNKTDFSAEGGNGGPPRTFKADSKGNVEEVPPETTGGGDNTGGGNGDSSGNGNGSGDGNGSGNGSGDGNGNGSGNGDATTNKLWNRLKQELNPKNPWRKNVITKLIVGYGIGAVNNIFTSILAHHWLWAPFGTGGFASTAAGFALDSLPFPENAILQTIIGQAVTIGTYEATKGPPPKQTTTTLPNGATEVTQTLPNGAKETVITEPDGTALTTTTTKGLTTEILSKPSGMVEVVTITKSRITITITQPDGQTIVTELPPSATPPSLLPTPTH